MNLIPEYCMSPVLDLTSGYGAPVDGETEILPDAPDHVASASFTFPVKGTPWVLHASFDRQFVSLIFMDEDLRHEIVIGGDLDDWAYWRNRAAKHARKLRAEYKRPKVSRRAAAVLTRIAEAPDGVVYWEPAVRDFPNATVRSLLRRKLLRVTEDRSTRFCGLVQHVMLGVSLTADGHRAIEQPQSTQAMGGGR